MAWPLRRGQSMAMAGDHQSILYKYSTNIIQIPYKYWTTIAQIFDKYFRLTKVSQWRWHQTTCQSHKNTLQMQKYFPQIIQIPPNNHTNTWQILDKYYRNTRVRSMSMAAVNGDEWPTTSRMLGRANNGNLSLCQNTSKGRKCLHQLWENMKLVNHDIQMLNWKRIDALLWVSFN